MTEKTISTKTRGGARQGAGRKGLPVDRRRVPITFYVTPDERNLILSVGKTKVIQSATKACAPGIGEIERRTLELLSSAEIDHPVIAAMAQRLCEDASFDGLPVNVIGSEHLNRIAAEGYTVPTADTTFESAEWMQQLKAGRAHAPGTAPLNRTLDWAAWQLVCAVISHRADKRQDTSDLLDALVTYTRDCRAAAKREVAQDDDGRLS